MNEAAIVLDVDKMFFENPPPSSSNKDKNIPQPPPVPKYLKDNPPTKEQEDKIVEEHIFTIVEQMPEYPGGFKALGSYITGMLQKLGKSENIKGKAKVIFTIDKDGKAGNVRIISKDNELAAKGAVTIVENMETWTPGKQRNKAVPVHYILPVEFK